MYRFASLPPMEKHDDFIKISYCIFKIHKASIKEPVKDVHRPQKLMTDFFQTFRAYYFGREYLNFDKKNMFTELTILAVNISISRKKVCLQWFPGGHFLRGLITKS